MSAAVVPRPARPSGVRASVAAKSVCVMLSKQFNIAVCAAGFCRSPHCACRRLCAHAVTGVRLGLRGAPVHHARARSICCRPSSSRSSTSTATRSSFASTDPDLVAQRRLAGGSQSLPRLRREGVRRVSVHRAAARLRRGAREIRPRHARTQRHAAVARAGDVRQPPPGVRGDGAQQRRTRSSDVVLFSAVSRRTTSRTPISRCTPRINYDGGQTGQSGIHARFERDLFERFQSRLTISPARAQGDRRRRETPRSMRCSRASSSSISCWPPIRRPSPARTLYDDAYFDVFFANGEADSWNTTGWRHHGDGVASSSAHGSKQGSRR